MTLYDCFNNEQFKKQACGNIIDNNIRYIINELTTRPDIVIPMLLTLLADEPKGVVFVSPVEAVDEKLDYFFVFDDDTKKGRIELNFRWRSFRAALDSLNIKENDKYDISKIFSETPVYDFVVNNGPNVVVETKFQLTDLWGHTASIDNNGLNYVNVVLREV